MNTSSESVWSQQYGIELFEYPQVGAQVASVPQSNMICAAAELEERCRAAYQSGIDEGEARARKQYDVLVQQERQAIIRAIQGFDQERQRYYRRIEAEVVQLSLAIARKILHRESQVDPLLLAGVVRVALQNMAEGSSVRIRVHPDQLAAWRERFSDSDAGEIAIEFFADASLDRARCVLETELGSSELGLEAQFKEIETGLLDLLAQRPGESR
jgi:flagellar assembly protein FliH